MPQSGVSGGRPRPKKLSPASVKMASATLTEKMITTEGITLGRMYLVRICQGGVPRLRAASTYRSFFTESVCPRTMRK